MLITRETDYALRILRTLLSGESHTAGEIAERESLPQKFAYKILKKLEKAGIVRITRGATGGCRLGCDLKATTLYDLIDAVETNARLTSCMTPGYECEWRGRQGAPCRIHMQLAKVQNAIDQEFRSRSLYWILKGDEEGGEEAEPGE